MEGRQRSMISDQGCVCKQSGLASVPTVGSGNDATLVPTAGTGQLDATIRCDWPHDAAHLIQLLGKDSVTIRARRKSCFKKRKHVWVKFELQSPDEDKEGQTSRARREKRQHTLLRSRISHTRSMNVSVTLIPSLADVSTNRHPSFFATNWPSASSQKSEG